MASSSAPLGLELLVPAGVAQLGIVRARSEYGLTDADLQGLPRSAHPGAGVVFSVKDLARVAILKGYRSGSCVSAGPTSRGPRRSSFPSAS